MENIEWILSIAATIATAIATIFMITSKLLKQLKADKQIIATTEVFNNLANLVIEAEEKDFSSGKEKKLWVLKQSEEYAQMLGIAFDLETVSAKIDTLIDLSRKVNNGNVNLDPIENLTFDPSMTLEELLEANKEI